MVTIADCIKNIIFSCFDVLSTRLMYLSSFQRTDRMVSVWVSCMSSGYSNAALRWRCFLIIIEVYSQTTWTDVSSLIWTTTLESLHASISNKRVGVAQRDAQIIFHHRWRVSSSSLLHWLSHYNTRQNALGSKWESSSSSGSRRQKNVDTEGVIRYQSLRNFLLIWNWCSGLKRSKVWVSDWQAYLNTFKGIEAFFTILKCSEVV